MTVAVQTVDNDGHFVTDGSFFAAGQSVNNRIDFDFDYAFTDRLSVTAGLPLIFAKYVDPQPVPPFVPFLPVDECRCWQSGWQDFGFTARYNLVNGAFALTPSVSVGMPSHDYNFRGEAAVGNHLKEVGSQLMQGSVSTRSRPGCPCRAAIRTRSSSVCSTFRTTAATPRLRVGF
ncbi:MAG: hypothetical protein Q7R30_23960 [Acidobacteriota bacterium]|nr:hypothetical protein [Acidobacteriota bacterium]